MPFVIFRARSRSVTSGPISEKALLHAELELRSSTNANTVAVAKVTGERGWRVEKKCLCFVFRLTKKSRVRGEIFFLKMGASYSTSSKLLFVARHILTTGFQKCL